ncbi:hypothetical protein HK100_003393 [Physocladia obscura]|uniref:Uncharacterized protein n=1 Tax=Physocladia obscura TaxID=109957 RepID=A0AAD5SU17_9FUNG|nr:hypothetical protein HK100_003393 [Physocladia obscura]
MVTTSNYKSYDKRLSNQNSNSNFSSRNKNNRNSKEEEKEREKERLPISARLGGKVAITADQSSNDAATGNSAAAVFFDNTIGLDIAQPLSKRSLPFDQSDMPLEPLDAHKAKRIRGDDLPVIEEKTKYAQPESNAASLEPSKKSDPVSPPYPHLSQQILLHFSAVDNSKNVTRDTGHSLQIALDPNIANDPQKRVADNRTSGSESIQSNNHGAVRINRDWESRHRKFERDDNFNQKQMRGLNHRDRFPHKQKEETESNVLDNGEIDRIDKQVRLDHEIFRGNRENTSHNRNDVEPQRKLDDFQDPVFEKKSKRDREYRVRQEEKQKNHEELNMDEDHKRILACEKSSTISDASVHQKMLAEREKSNSKFQKVQGNSDGNSEQKAPFGQKKTEMSTQNDTNLLDSGSNAEQDGVNLPFDARDKSKLVGVEVVRRNSAELDQHMRIPVDVIKFDSQNGGNAERMKFSSSEWISKRTPDPDTENSDGKVDIQSSSHKDDRYEEDSLLNANDRNREYSDREGGETTHRSKTPDSPANDNERRRYQSHVSKNGITTTRDRNGSHSGSVNEDRNGNRRNFYNARDDRSRHNWNERFSSSRDIGHRAQEKSSLGNNYDYYGKNRNFEGTGGDKNFGKWRDTSDNGHKRSLKDGYLPDENLNSKFRKINHESSINELENRKASPKEEVNEKFLSLEFFPPRILDSSRLRSHVDDSAINSQFLSHEIASIKEPSIFSIGQNHKADIKDFIEPVIHPSRAALLCSSSADIDQPGHKDRQKSAKYQNEFV